MSRLTHKAHGTSPFRFPFSLQYAQAKPFGARASEKLASRGVAGLAGGQFPWFPPLEAPRIRVVTVSITYPQGLGFHPDVHVAIDQAPGNPV
jgi:hypothetical protein